jgi:hypothetical protein
LEDQPSLHRYRARELFHQAVFILLTELASPKAGPELVNALLILGIFWALETGITILHCRRYIRKFIPEKRDPARAPQKALAKMGS